MDYQCEDCGYNKTFMGVNFEEIKMLNIDGYKFKKPNIGKKEVFTTTSEDVKNLDIVEVCDFHSVF